MFFLDSREHPGRVEVKVKIPSDRIKSLILAPAVFLHGGGPEHSAAHAGQPRVRVCLRAHISEA